MFNRQFLYSIIYALAATDGREPVLFGQCSSLAQSAFARSLAGDEFPELWFELPLAGDPWFDLHVLTSREGLDRDTLFSNAEPPCHPNIFEWFADQPRGVRQLALSHDLSAGRADDPAVQLLVSEYDASITCGFLKEAGRPDAADAYRAFVGRLPEGWFACYTGVFPGRPEVNLRVECIPNARLQHAYAHDASLLESHLRQVGFNALGDTVIPRCQLLARAPFQFELQFDVTPDGVAGNTLGASVRFACPPGTEEQAAFVVDGAAGALMQQVESWGLADDRWRLLEDVMFAKTVTRKEDAAIIACYPAFVKLRWKEGEPYDAKTYIIVSYDRSDA